jgi:hypothetical protein
MVFYGAKPLLFASKFTTMNRFLVQQSGDYSIQLMSEFYNLLAKSVQRMF